MYEAAFLFVIFLIFRIITGIALFLTWRETKKKNLLILLVYFIVNAMTLIFLIFENVRFYDISTILSIIMILIFIDRTFYNDRKSPFKMLLLLTIIIGSLTIVTYTFFELSIIFERAIAFFLHNIFVGSLFIIFGIWSFIAASNSLKGISSNELIEPWVKGRYKLVKSYSICIILVGIFTPFTPVEGTLNWALGLILIVNILRIAGETLAWIMPNFLKKFYNRNFSSDDKIEELSEEEIMEALK